MRITLREGIDSSSGVLEFYLNGLDNYDDFDTVVNLLEKKVELLEKINGIYSRTGTFDTGKFLFQLIYHEDVGLYAFSQTQSGAANRQLRKILNELVLLFT